MALIRICADFDLSPTLTIEAALKEAHRLREKLDLNVIRLQYGDATIHVGLNAAVCHNWPRCEGSREWKRKTVTTYEWVET